MKLSNPGQRTFNAGADGCADGGQLRVVQITDTHLYANPRSKLLGVNTFESLERVIDSLQDAGPFDFALATGDLVHDGSAVGYQRFCETVARLACPVYCIAGNHDEAAAIKRHINHPRVSTPRLIDADPWRVVFLDSSVAGKDGGRLSDDELAHLENALRGNRRPTLVCVHHQPVPVGSAWIDTMAIENAQELFWILDTNPQVKAVVWGHVHQEFSAPRGAMQLLATPSTCVQFLPGATSFAVDKNPPGSRIFDLFPDGGIRSHVMRLANLPMGLQPASSGY